jgi:hypothetical protein
MLTASILEARTICEGLSDRYEAVSQFCMLLNYDRRAGVIVDTQWQLSLKF